MVRSAQIDRIATRIEVLAPKSGRVYVWRNQGETAEEVVEWDYLTSPNDRFAGQTSYRDPDRNRRHAK